jgi:outer membrane protein OmpA-like peptidoglycan-associated protein
VATQPEKKGFGGLFKKIGKHLKEKASEVSNQTAENLVGTANQVVDVTTQTGTNALAGATAHLTNAAATTVGGVTKSLIPFAPPAGGADNLVLALSTSGANLPMGFGSPTSSALNADGLQLAQRQAATIKTIPGNFVIEAYVDTVPGLSTQQLQQLSEDRAGTVKSELIKNGVDQARLCALGYGVATPPTRGRVEIKKLADAAGQAKNPCLNQ